MEMKVIAHIKSDFPTKFGIPHQSGRIKGTEGGDCIRAGISGGRRPVRGIEEYTHLWLIWEFSQAVRQSWSPNSAASQTWGKCAKRRFCHSIPLSSQSYWTFQCEAGEGGFYRYGPCASCIRCGSYGWHSYL